jgi:hypothetical protein
MHKKRSLLNVAFVALASAATMTQAAMTGTTGKPATHSAPPAGPHFILSVPVELSSLPPEIDQYAVTCIAYNSVPKLRGEGMVTATSPGTSIVGRGSAKGAVSGANSKDNRDFKSTATVGIFIDFPGHTGEGPATVARRLASAVWYRCELTLSGTAYQVTTNYLSGNTTIPLAPRAPYVQFVEGPLPK